MIFNPLIIYYVLGTAYKKCFLCASETSEIGDIVVSETWLMH
jgi:hypothetical protein